ncbi:DNA-directed RNA polymerase subunit L [archaeon]|jgi:DNA-directed RNA polymerase subunit L|nr:DNA-directed RNA polymerase subunit L [archaeon]MBT4646716.1 DNA-directed RNA polymerase subunit L [archaeon]MBT6821077.1 DNA-directed RNA polymerase subunit L [archaeon]MBT7392070.1 DNA-directed RNA polymerase subunit L [archaeon]
MEINVIENKKKRFVFELKGEDHTLCNLLREELWNDKSITVSAYNIAHPLVGIPKIIVETDGKKDPKKALLDAVTRLKKKNSEFAALVKKQIK